MKKQILFLILFSIFFLKLTSQNNYNFDSIRTIYDQKRLKRDFKKAKYLSHIFLEKAKKQNDTSKIAEAYAMLSNVVYKDTSLVYADSAIAITKNNPDFWQPAKSYLFKANIYAVEGKYKEAFKIIDKANKYVKINNNEKQEFEITYLLSRLYTEIGDYEASIESIKSILPRYSKPYVNCDNCPRTLIILLWAYTNNLNFLKNIEGAEVIYDKAFPLSLKTKDSLMYEKLLLASAITKFQKMEYKASLDSIIKLEGLNKNYNPISNVLRYLYKGKIYLQLKKDNFAISYLKKADSISLSTSYFHPSIRENYELLVNYYKEQGDTENQLIYIDKLLKTDRIIDENYSYLTKNINKKYTTPSLLSEKQKIIDALKKKDSNKTMYLLFSFASLIIVSSILMWNNKKRKLYKKRIENLNNLSENKEKKSYSIDNEITKRILHQLDDIENSDLFLNKDFSLTFLAKKLDTNTAYLSKIINQHKEKTFKQYLVELRIKTLLKNLDADPMTRKYSIEALAESIGYTNASSFTRIFKNYLGESPSSFLEKKYPERKK